MEHLFSVSVAENNKEGVKIFVDWAQEHIQINPELTIFNNLIQASQFLNPETKGCDVIRQTD